MARPKKRAKRDNTIRRLTDKMWQALEKGDATEAAKLSEQILALQPNNAEALYARALLQMMEQNPEGAYETVHRALKANPDLVEAWALLATVADALGYTWEAYDAINQAIKRARRQRFEPEIIQGWEVMARDIKQALKRLFDDFHISPQEPEAKERLQRAFALYEAGVRAAEHKDVDKAVDNFRQLVDIAPNFPRGWGNLGTVLMMAGRLDEAEEALKRALALDPDYEPARTNMKALETLRKSRGGLKTFLHEFTALKRGAPRRKELK